MAGSEFDKLQFVGRHVPDVSVETDANGHKVEVPLPGMYEVGLLKDGVFRAVHTFKAAGLFADIARAKAAKDGGSDVNETDAGES